MPVTSWNSQETCSPKPKTLLKAPREWATVQTLRRLGYTASRRRSGNGPPDAAGRDFEPPRDHGHKPAWNHAGMRVRAGFSPVRNH